MKTPAVDLMLRTLRLPSMLASYRRLAEQAAKEHWGYEQYLQALAEEESEARAKRRIERLLKRSNLPDSKNLATLKKEKLPHQVRMRLPELRVEEMFAKLDKFEAVILDDIGYVQQSREEMEILFTFLAERYERKSLIITSNLVFSEWDQIFKNPVTTAAAVDRLVHHSVILEMTGKRSIRHENHLEDSRKLE